MASNLCSAGMALNCLRRAVRTFSLLSEGIFSGDALDLARCVRMSSSSAGTISVVARLRASSRRYDATTWLSPARASPIDRTASRSNMLAERKRTNVTAPSATAMTKYQKRDSNMLLILPAVGLGLIYCALVRRQSDVDVGAPQHEGLGRAHRIAREVGAHRVFAGRELRDEEDALRAGIGDGRHVGVDHDPASDAGRKLVAN